MSMGITTACNRERGENMKQMKLYLTLKSEEEKSNKYDVHRIASREAILDFYAQLEKKAEQPNLFGQK